MTIRIEVDTKSVNDSLKQLAANMGDMTKVMRKIAGVMEYAVEQNFQTEGARLGKRWKPSQRAMRDKGRTLQDTGRLIGSMVKDYGPNYAIVGTNVVYGPIHQFGGKAGRNRKVTMPPRPFLGLNAQDEQDIIKKITEALTPKG